MVGHGVNNIYEGVANIYHGPDVPSTVGPVRLAYRHMFDDGRGDKAYYSMDLILSAIGLLRPVPRPGSVELFRRDPINYEMAYRQMGKLALYFEVLVDVMTIKSISSE